MVDKPRNPRRNGDGPTLPGGRAPRSGEPGGRPGTPGRAAGKPATGPAGSRKATGGYDRRIVEQLQAEGLLSEEGRRFFAAKLGDDAPRKGAAGRERGAAARPGQGAAKAAPAGRAALGRPGRAEGPARPDRPARGEGFDRPARGAGPDRPARGEGFDRPARAARPDRPVRGEGFDRPTPLDRPVRAARPDRPDRPARPARTEGTDRPVRAERPAPRVPRAAAPARAGRGARLSEPETHVAERLHKVMAAAGVASRRHSEELIQAGRVTVNGRVVTELGTKVIPGRDIVEIDGRPLGKPEDLVYILLNKPKGYVTTLYDPQGRPKVTDLLGAEIAQRVYPVGRLDYDTEGLLLMTNDGQLANSLMHPAREVKKTYIAKVRGVPGPAKIKALEEGIELDDGMTAPAEVKLISASGPNAATLSIRIHEGRNRQVRRMCEAIGNEVIHLKRTTLGPLHLRDLEVGQFRELSDREVSDLKSAVGLRPTAAKPSRGARVAAIVEARKAREGGARSPRAKEPAEPAGVGAGPAPGRPARTGKPSFAKNRRPR
ncbi:MAG TPA: pseudouridine synthase [Symbiobacteriaceae bacterium]|nr:pseudouridine synthase [Symbiobacteriaceae bacterium]